jgi:3-phosphoshikimate 1-carboxyvinyltransferase
MQMTLEVLAQAGVEIPVSRLDTDGNDYVFDIECGKSYGLREFTVPGDFSSSSYLLAAAALTESEITVGNLFPSAQGDSRIVELLDNMGADISWSKEEGLVTVKGVKGDGLRGEYASESGFSADSRGISCGCQRHHGNNGCWTSEI